MLVTIGALAFFTLVGLVQLMFSRLVWKESRFEQSKTASSSGSEGDGKTPKILSPSEISRGFSRN